MSIQHFTDINQSHQATGYTGRTDLPDFHIFTIEDTYPSTRTVMPPYRMDWHQIAFFDGLQDAVLRSNADTIRYTNKLITFASPAHVMSWVRGEAQRGYIVYFREGFLPAFVINEAFPYFHLTEPNAFWLAEPTYQRLQGHLAQLLILFNTPHNYRGNMLRAQLTVLLYDCKELYDEQARRLEVGSAAEALVTQFEQAINNYYLTMHRVQNYADQLGVTPDYLTQVSKQVTGKTALMLIQGRILLEAKRLLLYTHLPIAEIADFLGFTEPTHFGRSFSRAEGIAPSVWRKQHQTSEHLGK